MFTGGIQSATIEDLDAMMNINVKSAFNLTQLCLPHLLESKGGLPCNASECLHVSHYLRFPGCIVNVSSLAGYAPVRFEHLSALLILIC
jgi:NAD(P)-dependent dehydrogenase (short-subunit alcohol dehydrogenase family)